MFSYFIKFETMFAVGKIPPATCSNGKQNVQFENKCTHLYEIIVSHFLKQNHVIALCDRAEEEDSECLKISATAGTGLQTLAARVEETIMDHTDRSLRHLRIPSSGQHLR